MNIYKDADQKKFVLPVDESFDILAFPSWSILSAVAVARQMSFYLECTQNLILIHSANTVSKCIAYNSLSWETNFVRNFKNLRKPQNYHNQMKNHIQFILLRNKLFKVHMK